MCDLFGARLAVATETEERRRFKESLIKTLCGGEDFLKGRRMHENFWEFRQTHKLFITGNHKPRVSSTDEAIWDRFRIIPFNVRFENPDKRLAGQLEGELPGILNWAIRGCLRWQKERGLTTPAAVEDATKNYRQEMDSIDAFLDECCDLGPGLTAGATDLFSRFEKYSPQELSQKAFGKALADKGFISGNFTRDPHKGRKCWHGLVLIPEGDDSPREVG
jgi:putative DNA primase/helicase